MDNKTILQGFGFGISAAFIWGGFPSITRLGMTHTLSSYDIAFLRFAVAGVLLAPLLWQRGLQGVGWSRALVLSCGAGAPYLLLTAGGLMFAPVAHFGVIVPSCNILFSSLLNWRFTGEKPTRRRMAGMAVVVAGLCLIGWESLAHHTENTWLGDAMFVIAGFFWASYTVTTRVWAVEPRHAIAIVSGISLLVYAPVYFAVAGFALRDAPLDEVVIQAVFQGVLSAIIALWLYTRAVAMLGAARGAVFGALVPSFAMLFAIPVLQEYPTRPQWMGVLLVTLGMGFALGLVRSRQTRPSSS